MWCFNLDGKQRCTPSADAPWRLMKKWNNNILKKARLSVVNLEQTFQMAELPEDFARMLLITGILGEPNEDEEVHRLRNLESGKWRIKIVGVSASDFSEA